MHAVNACKNLMKKYALDRYGMLIIENQFYNIFMLHDLL